MTYISIVLLAVVAYGDTIVDHYFDDIHCCDVLIRCCVVPTVVQFSTIVDVPFHLLFDPTIYPTLTTPPQVFPLPTCSGDPCSVRDHSVTDFGELTPLFTLRL